MTIRADTVFACLLFPHTPEARRYCGPANSRAAMTMLTYRYYFQTLRDPILRVQREGWSLLIANGLVPE